MNQFKLLDKIYNYELKADYDFDYMEHLGLNYTDKPKYIYVDCKTGLVYLPKTHQDYLFPINLTLGYISQNYLDFDDLEGLAISTLNQHNIDTDDINISWNDIVWNKKTKRHYVAYSDNKIIGWVDMPFRWEGSRYFRFLEFGNYGSSIDPKNYKEYVKYIDNDVDRLHEFNNGEWGYYFYELEVDGETHYTSTFESDSESYALELLLEKLPPMTELKQPEIGCGVIEIYRDDVSTYKIIDTKEENNKLKYELEDQLTGETHFNDLSTSKRFPSFYHFYQM